MFNELKKQIRQETGNNKATNMNHEIAQKLRKIGDDALNKKEFEKYIACYEMIAEDIEQYEKSKGGVPIDKSGAVIAYQDVLTKYVDCGYASNPEVLKLALKCRADIDEFMGENSMFPPVDGSLIDCMLAQNADGYYNEIEKYAKLDFSISLNAYRQNPNNPLSAEGLRCGAGALAKLYIYKGKYKDAYEILSQVPKDQLYPELISYLSILEAYKLTGYDSMTNEQIDNLLDIVENWAAKGSPEASWLLGIMVAEGHIYSRDINAAKQHFSNAEKFIEQLRGNAGRSAFDFKVFSSISQEEIIRQAEKGVYHSRFYYKAKIEKHANKHTDGGINSKQTYQKNNTTFNTASNSTPSESSGGCYVATCVYGSYDCPPVWTLRRYRDYMLAQNPFGRLFIKIYYATSPIVVKLFGNQNWFHKLFKAPLDRWVEKLNNEGVENTPYND